VFSWYIYLRLDPTCLRSGLLSNVEKGVSLCSPSRLILSGTSADVPVEWKDANRHPDVHRFLEHF
jgi:hypothetical protein